MPNIFASAAFFAAVSFIVVGPLLRGILGGTSAASSFPLPRCVSIIFALYVHGGGMLLFRTFMSVWRVVITLTTSSVFSVVYIVS